jgi:hypothetical protein
MFRPHDPIGFESSRRSRGLVRERLRAIGAGYWEGRPAGHRPGLTPSHIPAHALTFSRNSARGKSDRCRWAAVASKGVIAMKSLFFAVLLGCATIGAAVGCTIQAAPDETQTPEAGVGTVSLDLRGTAPNGNVYRLRNASFAISTNPPITLSSDGANLDAPVISTQLAVGNYTATLANGWILERQTGTTFGQVNATLVSSASQMFGIVANQTTSLNFQFSTNGQVVNVGNGTLNITVGITETDGGTPQACQLFVNPPNCPASQWCAPAPNNQPGGVCTQPGTAPVGGMCTATLTCVANAVCTNPNGGLCRQICQLGNAMACPNGLQCVASASMTFGLCQ